MAQYSKPQKGMIDELKRTNRMGKPSKGMRDAGPMLPGGPTIHRGPKKSVPAGKKPVARIMPTPTKGAQPRPRIKGPNEYSNNLRKRYGL